MDRNKGPTTRDKGIRISEDITEQCLLSVTKLPSVVGLELITGSN